MPNSPVTGSRATIEKVDIVLYSFVCAYNEGVEKFGMIVKRVIKTRHLLKVCVLEITMIDSLPVIKLFVYKLIKKIFLLITTASAV